MPCRKNFTDLTPTELNRLADALNELYDDGLVTQFANLHNDSWDHIHWEPQFLPWHRYFILRFEQALQAVDARITLPFWDWTRADSQNLDNGVWLTFFGGRANTGGRFDHWNLTRESSPVGDLPTVAEVAAALDEGSYTSFRQAVEPGEVHVAAHRWVGEDMFSGHSPRDPLFYLHHCNVDRIWAIWQLNNAGLNQYDTTAITSDGNSPGAPVAVDQPMVGGATPGSMLDHRAIGIRYPQDDALAVVRPGILTGDPIGVQLLTTTVWFNDIPEDEETRRPATFIVDGCDRLNFQVTAGPSAPFELHDGAFVSHPQTDLHTDEVRIWVRYRGTTEGATDSGVMTVRVTDQDGALVDEFVDIPLEANTVKRQKAAVVMVLDESGSMLADAGNNRTRLEVLQRAALTFIDNLFDDNGVALVSFDETATKLTDLADAGGMTSSVRTAARNAIMAHGPPNNQPHTSIGAGIQRATELYSDALNADDYDVKATLVFTDGVQDREPWISEVSAAVAERVYAVGVANAANVANDVLVQLASGSGGSMLVTGAIDQDDEFLLEKFFLQILAGVVNGSMINDPAGELTFGTIDEIDFAITRADIGFDAVILTRFPGVVLAGLRAPDGTVLQAANLPPGSLRVGSSSVDFRVTLPVVHNGVEHWTGNWQLLMTIGRGKPGHTVITHVPTDTRGLGSPRLPYHALIHARSNLRLRSTLDQDGLAPGSSFLLTAQVDEYGWPIQTHPTVRAILRRPDRSTTTVHLGEIEAGRYAATEVGNQTGVYRFRLIAEGLTTAGEPFTREQLLTGVLGRPSPPRPSGGSFGDGVRETLCDIMRCLREAMSPSLRKRLEASGIDVDVFDRCLCHKPQEEDLNHLVAQLAQPGTLATLRAALNVRSSFR